MPGPLSTATGRGDGAVCRTYPPGSKPPKAQNSLRRSGADRGWGLPGSGHPHLGEVPAVGHRLLKVRHLLVEDPVPVLLPERAVPGLIERPLLQVEVHLLPLGVVEAGAGI